MSKDDVVRALSSAIRRVSGTCLSNALAAQALLGRYGHPSILRIGAALTDGNFTAHAWVEHDREVVVGGPESVVRQYTPFPQPDAWKANGLKI